MKILDFRRFVPVMALCMGLMAFDSAFAKKPNILILMGDDIGMYNISAYHRGLLGNRTPNIDRLANEGAIFTDYYGEQSCTAGRSAFITGQHPYRTGLLTIGMPGSDQGISEKDPTIAEILKPMGYMTGQFGKNHLGDLDKFLPTNHGFDEFFGNLYHLNAEEEPETYFYPKDPAFKKKYAPRGVLKATADGNIEDTGPLTRKRMETADEEFTAATIDFIQRANKAGKPFFAWYNASRMHVWTHLAEKWMHSSSPGGNHPGYGLYADGMTEHDYHIGNILKTLDDLKIMDETIIIYTTDNGVEIFTYPDGGTGPFRGEKGLTSEGGFRVPTLIRWPGTVKPGTVINDIFSHQDWFPTLVAAAGGPGDITEQLKRGYQAGDKNFKVHLDGYNMVNTLAGKEPGKREEIFYFDAGGSMNAIRWGDFKATFTLLEGNMPTAYKKSPSWPKIVHLRSDPFERAPFESELYIRWLGDQMWLFVPLQDQVKKFLSTFMEFPQRQPVGSLSIDKVLKAMEARMAAVRAKNG